MKKIVCLMLLAGMLGACNATREDLGLELSLIHISEPTRPY